MLEEQNRITNYAAGASKKWVAPTWVDIAKGAYNLSKTKLVDSLSIQEQALINAKIVENEISLGMDRSVKSTNYGYGEIRRPELLVAKMPIVTNGMLHQHSINEMLVRVLKPNRTLLIGSGLDTKSNLLSTFCGENVFITNDYWLNKLEEFYDEEETTFDVVNLLDIANGEGPKDLDLILTSAEILVSYFDDDIFLKLIDSMVSGGTIILNASGDMMTTYGVSDSNSAKALNMQLMSPYYIMHENLRKIDSISFYHIPSLQGTTAIIKD
jgi:hypothetical protein